MRNVTSKQCLKKKCVRPLVLQSIFAVLAVAVPPARADAAFDPQRLWFNAGIYQYHFDSDKGLRNANPGLGVEYHYDQDWTWVAGRYINAKDAYSNYVGAAYQPWTLLGGRVGALVGAFNGYPCECDGNWFLGVIPAASWEFGKVGLNLLYVPHYGNRTYESLGFQFKVRFP